MSASNMAAPSTTQTMVRGSLAEIAKEFLRLGFVAFGGPPVHFAMMEERFVRNKKWLSRERFLDLIGAVSLLPGPSSTELTIYLGELRGGIAGLISAGAGFILPAAVMVAGLAWAYQRFGKLPQVEGLLFGIKPVVVALIVPALWNLGKVALKRVGLAMLAIAVVVLAALGFNVITLLICGGIFWMIVREVRNLTRAKHSAILALLPLGGSGSVGLTALLLYFLKIGAVVFGSGYVLLAVLRADLVVRLHWLTDAQLLDAIAVSQATPGPFFTVSTFIGYLLGGWKGAALATLGMFLPAFIFVAVTARFLPRLRRSPLAGAFLDGVNAAAVALMGFVAWQFARAALVSIPAIVLALASLFLIFRYKVNSAWLVLGGGVAGMLIRLFVRA
ncbi:MAG TPA: chromate efflux transporter [Candidatus Eremiobacteraceae bacterium]|nr:chromate efflux transporter [Candidatus Eremiobacteraceae bacterium]